MDPRNACARYAVAHPQFLHQQLQEAFPMNNMKQSARRDANVLYMAAKDSDRTTLYVQSDVLPSWTCLEHKGFHLEGVKDITRMEDMFQEGSAFAFSLLANTTTGNIERYGNKRRRYLLKTPEEKLSWLNRRAEQNGFMVVNATVNVQKTLRSTIDISKQTGNFSLVGTAFEGVLKITDPALFKAAFRKGIGQGKAYGFGMLMLMRKVAA